MKAHKHDNNNNGGFATPPEIKIAILTCSDKGSRGLRIDTAGPSVEKAVRKFFSSKKGQRTAIKISTTNYAILPDDRSKIRDALKKWCDGRRAPDIIFTVGGTGMSKRDVTPEATRDVMDKLAPGIPEYIRWESFKKTKYAALSRATAGIRKNTLIINLPGSLNGASETASIISPLLAHAVEILRGHTEHDTRSSG